MHHITGEILGKSVHIDTLYFAWGCMAFVLLLAWSLSAGISADTSKFGVRQYFVETIFGFLRGLVTDQVGKKRANNYTFFIGSIFLFILTCYYAGLLPWKLGSIFSWWPQIPVHQAGAHGHDAVHLHPWHGASPVADLNVPAAMALMVIFVYFFSGVKVGGWKYIESFLPIRFTEKGWNMLNPMCLIELMDLIVRPLTLSLRLFANTVAGETLLSTFITLTYFIIPVFVMGFELAVGLLQSFLFTILSTVYIATAIQHAEHCVHEHAH
ncbi:MAG: F0F1 ATP synthase subunit A [Candidatus Melainabacteria bacterium]|nr:F0F1 ATP synthase subunit A [Candidatus Melainabacteria bacterium]